MSRTRLAIATVLLAGAEALPACQPTLPWFDPVVVCEGQPAMFNAGLLSIADCPAGVEYRFSDANGLLQDWSFGSTYSWTATASFTLGVTIRCSTDHSCGGGTPVEVVVVPDVVPAAIGNGLGAMRAGDRMVVTYPPAAGSIAYRLRGSEQKSFAGNVVLSETTWLSGSLEPPALTPPAAFHVRVAGVGCSGAEGP